MAAFAYESCLSRLLLHEGGYTNHPSDPGGPTNFGITIDDYRKFAKPGATAADVRAMNLDEAKAIYRAKYWDAQRCDALPAGVDYAVFDYGVNSGIGRSGKVLRRCLDLHDNTSVVNDMVIAAAARADAKALIAAICDERLRFLKSLRTWAAFGKGWGRRVAEVKAYSLCLAGRQSGAAPRPMPDGTQTAKGMVPVQTGARHGVAGTAAVSGAVAVQRAHASGAGIGTILTIGVLAFVAAFAVYAFWDWWQRRQQEAAA
jgi:lysozyme family protein